MAQISVNNLTFYYEGSADPVFEEVSFQIDTDWKLGLVARNGRGKTTLLKLLMQEYEYRGNINSSEEFDYFPFPIQNRQADTLQAMEEVYPEYEFWKICRELNLLQVDADVLYRPFSTLSNGEQTKVMLAVLFSMDEKFLLIDEPTNHLDIQTRKIVQEYLRQKKGYILVSHDRDFLDACIDHVLAIQKENIEVEKGNFSSYWENKQRQDAYERDQNDRLKKEIDRLQEGARRTGEWAKAVESTKIGKKSFQYERNIDTRAYVGEKSRRMEKRRKNLEHRQEKAIEEKSELLKNIEKVDAIKLFHLEHYKDTLIQIKDIQINYEDKQLAPVSLEIKQGDRIALTGPNGCGKTSLLRLILQETDHPISYHGTMEKAGNLVISYCAQDTSGLFGSLLSFAEKRGIDYTTLLTVLRKLDFQREQFEKRIEDYSGGQKKKLLIAASLCTKAHLYIWDEPLNFIDVFSRMQIEELIQSYQPTMLFVEHDTAFIRKVATQIKNW